MVLYKKKEKNTTEEEQETGKIGSRYSYVAIDAVSRLLIAVVSGRRIQETANKVLSLVAKRVITTTMILFTSDDWDQYLGMWKK